MSLSQGADSDTIRADENSPGMNECPSLMFHRVIELISNVIFFNIVKACLAIASSSYPFPSSYHWRDNSHCPVLTLRL